MEGSATDRLAVGPFISVRCHGTQKYAGSYSDRAIEDWAEWLAARYAEGRPIYAYFNNDTGGHAPRDAVRLREALAARVSRADRAGRAGRADRVGRTGSRSG